MPIAAAAGPIISGVGGIVGGIMGASAAKKAAAKQEKMSMAAAQNTTASANNATDYNNQIMNLNRSLENPWVASGQSAIANVTQRLGLPVPAGIVGPSLKAGMLTTPTGPGQPPAPPPAPGAPTGIQHLWRGSTGKVKGPGTSTSDSIPADLSKGEVVVNASAARMPGVTEMLMRLNRAGDGKSPHIGGSHFDTGGMVTPPGGPTGISTPANTGPSGVMTPAPPSGSPATSTTPSGSGTGTQPFAGVNAAGIADPTVRTIVGAAQGGVNMNSLPGGQTANNEQPGLMNSLNIGPNGQIPGAPGYAGSSAPPIPGTGFGVTQAMKGMTGNPATQGGVMTPNPTASGVDAALSSLANPGGFTSNTPPGEAMAPPSGPTGLMTQNPATDPAASAPTGAAPGSNFDPLNYGNLTQGYDPQFSAPTGVTEQNDPGFQFRLQQGQQALERSAAARGGLLTGGTAKDLANYQQGLASQEYQGTYNRALQGYQTNQNTFYQNQNNLYNRLMGISGAGQNAANNLVNAGTASAGQIGNIDMTSAGQVGQDLTNAGTSRASGIVGANNSLAGILPGVGNSLSLYNILNPRGVPGQGPMGGN